MKISVVVTILNEGESIEKLLESLARQTLKPEETILVDAGSTDGTVEKVKEWKWNNKLTVKLIEKKGANRSAGRNIGVTHAKNKYIAVTDAGCWVDKRWLAELAEGFKEEGVEVVAGYYQMETDNGWEEVFSWYMGTLPDAFDERNFLPSSRSLAFTKAAWKKTGGYPEELDYCEDLVLADKLRRETKMVVRKEALVYWQMPKNVNEFFGRLQNYAYGDITAKYKPHLFRIATVFGRYLVFSLYPVFFLVYPLLSWWKFRKRVRSVNEMLKIIVVQIIADVGVMWGAVRGLVVLVFRQ